MTNIIRQQTFLFDWHGAGEDAAAIQQRATALCREKLLPALEAALEQLAPDHTHWCLDRLELDLGSWSPAALDTELVPALTKALEEQVERTVVYFGQETDTEKNGLVRKTSIPGTAASVFVLFLETGRLPWYYKLLEGQSLEQALEAQLFAGSGAIAAFQPEFLRVIRSPDVRKRLVWQFSAGFLHRLLALQSGQAESVVQALLDSLEQVPVYFQKKAAYLVWQAAFETLAQNQESFSANKLRAVCAKHLMEELEDMPELSDRKAFWPNLFSGTTDMDFSETPEAIPDTTRLHYSRSDTEVAEPVYLDHAGIILLHPFLPRLFEALEIADDTSIRAPGRALALLHYAATGQEPTPEYELPLAKILCGIPVEKPVDTTKALTDKEKEEVTGLLQAVIKHWGALGNSVPDALRGTFLVRPGKLSRRGDEWLLQVEAQTLDILLDQLPWSISAIQTPWMSSMLWVEWGNP
ncbi:MAG: hypothetical protein EP344_11350 [Bacteroidetes bacterium]|nr:MAG: hypothetical protein EP344_11350 [Bacteroidota bacterium]